MDISLDHSPFATVLKHLDDSDVIYVFAGIFRDGDKECEVRHFSRDALTTLPLLEEAYGDDYSFNGYCINPYFSIEKHDQEFRRQLKTDLHELIKDIAHLEFALLWTPPASSLRPHLANSVNWDDARVREQLFLTSRKGLENYYERRISCNKPAIAKVSSYSTHGLKVPRDCSI